jgi:hypothetical protein
MLLRPVAERHGRQPVRRTIPAWVFLCLLGWPQTVLGAEPIATTDGEWPGLSIKVEQLKVVSGALMLKFAIENNNDKDVHIGNIMSSSEVSSVDGIFLVDIPGRKKYLVVRDADGHCLCSRGIYDLGPNSSSGLWARFPTPPDSVQKIGIVVPHFMPMDDVPISR